MDDPFANEEKRLDPGDEGTLRVVEGRGGWFRLGALVALGVILAALAVILVLNGH
jgi:hypothetical protein